MSRDRCERCPELRHHALRAPRPPRTTPSARAVINNICLWAYDVASCTRSTAVTHQCFSRVILDLWPWRACCVIGHLVRAGAGGGVVVGQVGLVARWVCRRRRLVTAAAKRYSLRAAVIPRREKARSPRRSLRWAWTGSTRAARRL